MVLLQAIAEIATCAGYVHHLDDVVLLIIHHFCPCKHIDTLAAFSLAYRHSATRILLWDNPN